MSDEKKQDSKPAADDGAPLKKLQAELDSSKAAVASLKADLASAVGLLKEKDERIADLKDMVEHLKSAAPSGPAVLVTNADASEASKAAARHQKLHDMRAEAMEIAGPDAQSVKYIVGPSGTVRPDLGPVKAGVVIDVPVTELPAGEWKVWTPEFKPAPAPRTALTARDIQARNGPSAAEKAIAQREALKNQLRDA